MATPHLDDLIANAPKTSGCYIMKDEAGTVLYIGKAKNIKNRVRSYFREMKAVDENGARSGHAKTIVLVAKIHTIEFLETSSEVEALLLENNLIKKHRPRYNIRLKDDKTYPYIWLDTKHPFPRPYFARKPKDSSGLYFGPYPNAFAMRQLLQLASKAFLLRDCRDNEFANRSRPCLSYQIGQCTAPCVAYVDEESYKKQVQDFLRFLKGENETLREEWKIAMEKNSEAQHYEEAARYRDRLAALDDLQNDQRAVDLNDQKSRDIWIVWPPDFFDGKDHEVRDVDILMLQFREGKWWGRKHFPISLEEVSLDKESFLSLLAQYYAKADLPAELIVPPDCVNESAALEEYLRRMSEERNHLPFEFEKIVGVDEGHKLWRIWNLALQNVRGVNEDQTRQRERRRGGLEELAIFLDIPAPLTQVECMDVSNFQGSDNVAACVVFLHGKRAPDLYRHYGIKSVQGQNDFASLREVVRRRYGKVDSPRPQLLIVDGGRAQLDSVMLAMKEVGVDFPVVGLAKARTERNFQSTKVESTSERFFLPGQKNPKIIKNAELLRLVSEMRDEAHRFAITFHRQRRDKIKG